MSIKINKMRYSTLSLTAASLISLTHIALAQTGDGNKKELEELVVTGTRMVSDIQDTAVAGTVLSGEGMAKKNVLDLTSVQYAAPGVTIASYGSANTFNMRGVGRSKVDIDIPSGVQMYRDGVAMFPGYFQNEPYYDMAGMEVLRGPQGTIAGKSASGGALFIRTRSPDLNETNGFLNIGAGNFAMREASGAINLPMGDTAAMRLAINHKERDDRYDYIIGTIGGNPDEVDLNSARLGIKWNPSDNLETLVKIDWNDLDFGGTPSTSYGEDPRKVVNQGNFRYEDGSVRIIADVKYHLDSGITLTSLTGYQHADTVNNTDQNGSVGPFDSPTELPVQFNSRGDFYLYSQEFNLLSSEDGDFRWVTGIFAQRIESEIPEPAKHGFELLVPGLGILAASPWDNDEDDLSAFGNLWYDLSDSLEFELGVRYSKYERVQETSFIGVLFGGALPPSHDEISENSTDYKVGLNWRPTDDDFIYAFVARGHTTGGINILPPWNTYDEVEVIDFETGWKGSLLDDRLRTQIGVYYQTLDNFQGVFGTGVGSASETRNAEDDSTIYGIEFSGQALLGNLGLDFGFAYTKTELGDFTNVVIPAALLQWFPGNTTGVTNISGAQSPYSPEWTFNIGLEYNFQLGGDLVLTPRIDYAHIDEQKDGLFDIPPLQLKERDLVNIALNLESGAAWSLRGVVTNATDENYVGGIQNNGQNHVLAPPRMYSVNFEYNF